MREVVKPGMLIMRDPPDLGEDRRVSAAFRNHLVEDNIPLSYGQRPEELDHGVRTLVQMFPKICPKEAASYLGLLPAAEPGERALQLAVEHFLKHGFPECHANGASTSYPVASSRNGHGLNAGRDIVDLSSSDADGNEHNGDDETETELYNDWCVFRLSVDFPRVGLLALKAALKLFGGNLGPAYKAVYFQNQRVAKKKGLEFVDLGIAADEGSRDSVWLPKGGLKLLKADRFPRLKPPSNSPRFERDWRALQGEFGKSEDEVNQDEEIALSQDDFTVAVPPAEVLIECGCCCVENAFEDLVQCADGHLFCTECLRRHLEGYIFGGSQSCGLPTCMDTNGCDKSFPWSEVKRALPLDVLSKYELRQAEDAVARAKLEGLVYCPFCNHPWEVDRGMTVLYCLNETCRKASCIKCKEPNHQPQRCDDVEKKSATSLRRKVEERMTKAVIRECAFCKAQLVKIDGCNKIKCRCGQNMCYVCRLPIKDYSHFCQHAREPGLACLQCSGCSLWEREDEAEVVKVAKEAAIQEVGAQDRGLLKRDIGPSDCYRDPKRLRSVHVPFYP